MEYSTQFRKDYSQEDSQGLVSGDGKAEQSRYPHRLLVDRSRLRKPMYAALATSLLVSMLLGTVIGIVALNGKGSTTINHSGVTIQPCGSSPEEAIARGCHFDVISFCWLAHDCYDSELSDDFRHRYHLEWFVDSDRKIPLSYEDIMTGKHTGLYVNWEYHIAHCTAMWKKMHRAILGDLGKGAIDSYIGSYEHTKHCEMMLLGDRNVTLDTINTRIAVKYPDCGIE